MTTSIHFPGPGDLGPHEPVLMHDDFRQIVSDVNSSRAALVVLKQLLHDSGFDALDGTSGTGLATLLEGAHHRMQLALDGLLDAAQVLGVEVQQQPTPPH